MGRREGERSNLDIACGRLYAKHMPALKGAQLSAPGDCCHKEMWVSLAMAFLKKKKETGTFDLKCPQFEMLATNPNFYKLCAHPLGDFLGRLITVHLINKEMVLER